MPVTYRLGGREVSREEFAAASDQARLQDMLRSRKAPLAKTDNTFLAGHCNGSQFQGCPEMGDTLAAVARAGGQDPKGKVYLSGLARMPGDPEAWVSGTGDVRRVLEKRGWASEGDVNVSATQYNQVEPFQGPKVDPDILDGIVDQWVQDDPGLAVHDRQELLDKALDQHGPPS